VALAGLENTGCERVEITAGAGADTVAVTVHEPSAGIEPPVRVTVEEPLPPVTVPPQVLPPSAETVTPLAECRSGARQAAAALPELLSVR